MGIEFRKAERTAVRLKIGIQGPSGSGKTDGALALATSLAAAEGSRIAFIDTENESASLYADRYDFDTLPLRPPYESARYMEAIRAAVDAGYKVLVIDSLSHQWAGEGGILARKEAKDARGGNSFTNWAQFTKEHESFKAGLLNAPIHIIATLRTKTEYVIESDIGKRAAPKKVGTAPVQRDGMEYEFSVMWELQMDHRAGSSKDRTGLFDGRFVDLRDKDVHQELIAWLKSGKPANDMAVMEPLIAKLLGYLDDKQNALTQKEREQMVAWAAKERTADEIRHAIARMETLLSERAKQPAA